MTRGAAPRPWEEAYRTRGRLWRGERLDGLTARWLDAHPEAADVRWLDAGCGDGKGLLPLARRLARDGVVAGVDRAVWGLRRAREAPGGPALRLVRCDVRALPFPDGAFDVVRAVHVVGHLVGGPERQAVMGELARVLAPAGTLLVSDFAVDDFRFGQGVEVEDATFRRGEGITTHYFRDGELEGSAERAGLRVDEVRQERFEVKYGGRRLPRARWDVVARPQETS